MTEEQIATVNTMIVFSYYTQLLEKKSVWFMINNSLGSYYILMYYDNGYIIKQMVKTCDYYS